MSTVPGDCDMTERSDAASRIQSRISGKKSTGPRPIGLGSSGSMLREQVVSVTASTPVKARPALPGSPKRPTRGSR